MTDHVVSPDGFAHVRIIVGMVLGLSIARLVNGLTRFIQHPGRDRIDPIHFGWVVFVLIAIVHTWWYEFHLRTIAAWGFGTYVFVLAYAMNWVVLAALLFPDSTSEYSGFRDYFQSRKAWFYGFLALSFVLDTGDTLLKGGPYFASLGPEYVVRQIGFVAASITAAVLAGTRFQAAFVAIAVVYDLSWILRTYDVLG